MRVEGIHVTVLPSAPKVSFVTLLSVPHCHAAFSTVPHTLASVDQSTVFHPKMVSLRGKDA
jgi:hypothetical protein